MRFSKYNDSRQRGDPPVVEGKEYDVEVLSVGAKGDGIAKVNGFVVIVPNTQKGDKVRVKISAVRGTVSFGEVVGKADSAGQASKDAGSDDDAGSDEESDLNSDEGETEESGGEGESEEEN